MLQRVLSALHVHWFRPSWTSYAYAYEECRCHKRRAKHREGIGRAPLALWWLEGRAEPVTASPPNARVSRVG